MFPHLTLSCVYVCVCAGCRPEEDGGWERSDPKGIQPLLRPDHRQRQPGQGLRDVTGRRGQTVQWTAVGPGELGVLKTSCSAPFLHTEWVTVTQQHVCVCVFSTTKAKEEEKRADILDNNKKKILSDCSFSSWARTQCNFFLLKTQRERVLIYFITFYERSFYSMWNSSENETKKKVGTWHGPYFCINLLS